MGTQFKRTRRANPAGVEIKLLGQEIAVDGDANDAKVGGCRGENAKAVAPGLGNIKAQLNPSASFRLTKELFSMAPHRGAKIVHRLRIRLTSLRGQHGQRLGLISHPRQFGFRRSTLQPEHVVGVSLEISI